MRWHLSQLCQQQHLCVRTILQAAQGRVLLAAGVHAAVGKAATPPVPRNRQAQQQQPGSAASQPAQRLGSRPASAAEQSTHLPAQAAGAQGIPPAHASSCATAGYSTPLRTCSAGIGVVQCVAIIAGQQQLLPAAPQPSVSCSAALAQSLAAEGNCKPGTGAALVAGSMSNGPATPALPAKRSVATAGQRTDLQTAMQAGAPDPQLLTQLEKCRWCFAVYSSSWRICIVVVAACAALQ